MRLCPICLTSCDVFETFGVHPREDARCPTCHSLERHRLLWLYLWQHKQTLLDRPLRVVHFAADVCLIPALRAAWRHGYSTADLEVSSDDCMDLRDMSYPSGSIDLFMASHVLEHVPSDRKALQEIYRVLKPGGMTIIQVPTVPGATHDFKEAIPPHSHWREYGRDDFAYRMVDYANFEVKETVVADLVGPEEAIRLGVAVEITAGEIYAGTKGA